MINKLIKVSFFLLIALTAISQPLEFEFSTSSMPAPGGVYEVDVKVANFDELLAAQVGIYWDSTVMRIDTLPFVTGALPDFNRQALSLPEDNQTVVRGKLKLSWSSLSLIPQSLPDGTLLFTMRFDIVGMPCDTTSLTLGDPQPPFLRIEVIHNEKDEIGAIANNFPINIPGTDCGSPPMDCETDDLQLVFQNSSGECGDNICIPMVVNNFDDVSTFQMSAGWDPSVMTYTGVQNFVLPGSSPGSFNVNQANGTVTYVWFDNSTVMPQTLTSGSTLFELCFELVGDIGSSSIEAQDMPTIIQASDSAGDILSTCTIAGTVGVTADCDINPPMDCEFGELQLVFQNTTGACGDNVCIPMTVTNFDDVSTFQMSASWNPSVLTYTNVQNFILPGSSPASFNVNEANGTVTYVWFDNSTVMPQTFADGTTLFELCFDIIGDRSTSSIVAQSTPTVIQVSDSAGDIVDACPVSGDVTVSADCGGSGSDEFTLVSQSVTASGPTVCVDITTRNFDDIVTAQFAVQWDDAVLCYNSLTNLNQTLPLFESLFNQVGDVLRFSWNNPDPVDLPDGTVLFTICYDVKADNCGAQVPITFIGDPVPIEIAASGPNGDAVIPFDLDEGTVSVTLDCPGIIVDPTITRPSCNGDADGSIRLALSGGTPPYTCDWGALGTTTDNAVCVQEDLTAGNYSVTISDSAGDSEIFPYQVTEPQALVINGNTSATTINYAISGGTPPYMEQFNPPVPNLNDVPAGIYTLLVTDANQCQQTRVFNVTGIGNPDVVVRLDGVTSATCGATGIICVTCTGGTGSFSDPRATNNTTNQTLTYDRNQACFINAPAGSYTVRCTDSNGSTGERVVNVPSAPPTPLNCQVTNVRPAICDLFGGAFDVICTGGCPGYGITVSLDGGPKTNYNPNSSYPPGNYTVCIRDSSGEEQIISFNLPVEDNGNIGASAVTTPAMCNSNGSVTPTITGGCSPSCTITDAMGNETNCSTGVAVSLPAGTYTLTAEDGMSQPASTTFIIETESPDLMVDVNSIEDAPCASMNGSVSLNVSGGCGNTTCTILIGNTGTPQPCNIIGGAISAPAGNHTITITDNDPGIPPVSIPVTIPISPDALSVSLTGQTMNSVDITAMGGQMPYSYTWTFPDDVTMINTEDLSDLTESGIYSLSVVDAIGCSAGLEATVDIINPTGVVLNVDSNTLASDCGAGPDCNGEITGTVLNGTAPYNITISDQFGNSTTFQIAQAGSFILPNICGGNYSMSVVDADGGTDTFGSNVEVMSPEPLTIEEDDVMCSDFGESNGSVAVFVDGGNGGYDYMWSPSLPNAGPSNDNLAPGTYVLNVTDINGCSSSITLIVEDCNGTSTDNCGDGLLVMTPNGDGINDNLIITCADTQENTVAIYDRYGRNVFSATNYRNGWNGIDMDGEPLQEGAYHWVYIVDGQITKGTITLLRD